MLRYAALIEKTLTVFPGILVVVAVLFVGTAEAGNIEKKRTFGLRKEGTSHIQMRSMMVPALRSKKSKRTSTTAVTVILTVKNSKRVGFICDLAPKINDSLMRAWYKKPVPAGYLYDRQKRAGKTNVDYRRTPGQKAEDKRLIRIINRAIGSKEVAKILVLKGTMRLGGGAVTRLPFSSVNGCDELVNRDKKKKN